jgi:hypothetical protein
MTIRDLIARLGKVDQEVMGQAMLCDTAESLQALAEENSIALSMQEGKRCTSGKSSSSAKKVR